MENSSGHTTTVLNKILIPVITTVLGATAIYFLGFNNKKGAGRTDMEQMLISKEATVKAWRSFVTSQNISYRSINSLSEEYGQKVGKVAKEEGIEKLAPVWKDFEDEILRESRKGDQDVKDILKDTDIDRDFISMLNRLLTNGKDQEDKLIAFFDKMISVAKSDLDQNDKALKIQSEYTTFMEKGKKDQERMVNESEAIAKVLAEKYNQAFNLNDLEVYVDIKKEKEKEKEKKPDEPVNPKPDDPAPVDPNKPANDPSIQNTNQIEPTISLLAGQWEMTGGILELSRDGDMYWTFDAKGYTSGDWKLSEGTIRMNATNPDTKKTAIITGYISDFKRTSFTLTFINPKEVYYFTKKVDY
jgi:hypothetical protein